MKSQLKALVVGSMTALIGMAAPATVFANGVCYAVRDFNSIDSFDGGPPLIVRYIATNVGSINSDAETKAPFYHLKQQAYSLVGKGSALINLDMCQTEPCANTVPNGPPQVRIMTTLDGTIITGTGNWSPDEPGAHMGLDVQFLRFLFGEVSIGPITLECTSEQPSKTPRFWICNTKTELNVPEVEEPPEVIPLVFPVILEKVKASDVPACSVFQDGGGELPIGGEPPV